MSRFLVAATCLSLGTHAFGVSADELPDLGPVLHGGGDEAFIAMLPALEATFAAHPGTIGTPFGELAGLTSGMPFDLRIWFISASGGNTNSLGLSPVLGDASAGGIAFSSADGLALGDYVDIAPTDQWLPFVISDHGADGSATWFGASFLNADFMSHVEMAFVGNDANSIWYALAVDDQFDPQGDRSWDGLRVALQFSVPVVTPEPETWAMVLGFVTVGGWLWRRERSRFLRA